MGLKIEKVITVSEQDWPTSIYKTKEWEQSVNIVRWEHDYVKKCYIINYEELEVWV